MIYGYIRTSRAAVDGLAGMHSETQVQGPGRCRRGAGQHRFRRGYLRLRPGQRPPRVDRGGVAWCRNRQTGNGKPDAKPDRRRP